MRINAYLARALGRSRRHCDGLVKAGLVKRNGRVAQLHDQVEPGDEVTFAGRRLSTPDRIYLMLNKPAGVITAVSDGRTKTVMALLPPRYQELFPVGRLDRDSRGLLLFTNDGDFAQEFLHPCFGVPRRYRVRLDKEPDLTRVRKPVELEDGLSVFDAVEPVSGEERSVEVVLRQGRKRQIRRAFRALGYRVVDLVRTQMGDIKLGDLPEGAHRLLSADEVRRAKRKRE